MAAPGGTGGHQHPHSYRRPQQEVSRGFRLCVLGTAAMGGGLLLLCGSDAAPLVHVPPVTTWTMEVPVVGAWEAVPEIGLGRVW